jgi:hypothetical protein
MAADKVELTRGAAPPTAGTLVTTITTINTLSYLSTGDVGTQYRFQIVPTDGTNEDPVQTFVSPTGQTRTASTPTPPTPTGKPMPIPVDNRYLSKDEYLPDPNGLKRTTSSGLDTSGVLDTILPLASGAVKRSCRRHVDGRTIDEVYQGIRIGQDMGCE